MADGGLNRSSLVLGIFSLVAGVAFLLDQLDVWDLRIRYVRKVPDTFRSVTT